MRVYATLEMKHYLVFRYTVVILGIRQYHFYVKCIMILYMTALLLVHPMRLRLMNEYHKLFWIWMTPTLFLICVSSIATQTQFILGGIRHLSRRHHSSC